VEEESKRVLLNFEANNLLVAMLPIKLQMVRIVAQKFEDLI